MFSSYSSFNENGTALSPSVEISRKFSPAAAQLTTRLIKSHLGYSLSTVSAPPGRQTYGLYARVDAGRGEALLPTSGIKSIYSETQLFEDSFNLFGRRLEPEDAHTSTPERERRVRMRELEEKTRADFPPLLNHEADGHGWQFVDADRLEVEKLPEETVNMYPSWERFISGLEDYAPEMTLVANDEVVGRLLTELERLWLVWNSKSHLDFHSDGARQWDLKRQ